ncbi:exodeoxyribonuclease VII small subunit [Bacteroidales bacterium OttesenSCG-928-J19]|nr:exodeoxyribonuclease VII small subunit [Bacteroidales bacterium OttesenSCG-928-J19]
MAKKGLSYNEAFGRLREIQTLIEEDKLDVDQLTDVLTEANVLLKTCKDKLFKISEETAGILKNIPQ